MSLPSFRDDGWLPQGHHPTTWEEIEEVFGGETGSVRTQVMARLLAWRDLLRSKGIQGYLILDGSFISQKPEPGDFDTILVGNESVEVILAQDIDAALLVNYTYCKQQGWGDIFYLSEESIRRFPELCRTDGFDYDKITRTPKGVVEVSI
jgi:hypothetical protein